MDAVSVEVECLLNIKQPRSVMLRSSAALQNLSDLAGGLEPSSSRAALVVTGSVALDSHAKAGIKQAVTAAGLAVEDEKLHPTGLDDELAAEVKTRCIWIVRRSRSGSSG